MDQEGQVQEERKEVTTSAAVSVVTGSVCLTDGLTALPLLHVPVHRINAAERHREPPMTNQYPVVLADPPWWSRCCCWFSCP